jgi:hypothetical protein
MIIPSSGCSRRIKPQAEVFRMPPTLIGSGSSRELRARVRPSRSGCSPEQLKISAVSSSHSWTPAPWQACVRKAEVQGARTDLFFYLDNDYPRTVTIIPNFLLMGQLGRQHPSALYLPRW